MEDFRAGTQRLGEGSRAERHDHEFLEVDRIIRMHAAVDDIHHRHRQKPRRGATDIAVERQPAGCGRCLGDRKRHAEDSVGAQATLVGRAVERDHGLIDLDLGFGIHTGQRVENLAVDGFDGVSHALAEIALLVAVAQLDRFVRPRRSAEGTPARPREPSSSTTSTSTVGLPRLSRISRPMISTMAVMLAPAGTEKTRCGSGGPFDVRGWLEFAVSFYRIGEPLVMPG